MKVETGKTYIGVVEDIKDPEKLGRVKVRVLDVFDDTPIEDIPFATPWKDLSGNEFNIPEVGKIVTVVFENGNINSPEFISSEHFNINLEKKLSILSQQDYESMKSVIFDHKTQIYVNDSEGLVLDYKFNKLNIKDNSINLELKDNYGKVNIGTSNATQRSILGDNFLNWFDQFVNILVGSPYFNLGGPVTANPALITHLQLYKGQKDPSFLSKNIYMSDNNYIDKLDRISEAQKGDSWQSTVKDNKLTSIDVVSYNPLDGSTNTTFDSSNVDSNGQLISDNLITSLNPDINIIIELLNNKKYKLYEDPFKLNIIAVRNQCISIGDVYTDLFVDKIYIMFKDDSEVWQLRQYLFSTVPGLEFNVTASWLNDKNLNGDIWESLIGQKIFMKKYIELSSNIGLSILSPSQYIDSFFISSYKGYKSMDPINGSTQLIWLDRDYDNLKTFSPDNFFNPEVVYTSDSSNSIKIHIAYPSGKKVGNWSEGSQTFPDVNSLNDFFKYCSMHSERWGNIFSYTLVTKKDWDEAYAKIVEN